MSERCSHCGGELTPDDVLEWGGYVLDEPSRLVYARADPAGAVHLSGIHCAIVGALMRAKGRVITHESMFNMLYSARPQCDWPEIKIVDVQICKLRAAVPWLIIETSWGVGKRLLPYGSVENTYGKRRRAA